MALYTAQEPTKKQILDHNMHFQIHRYQFSVMNILKWKKVNNLSSLGFLKIKHTWIFLKFLSNYKVVNMTIIKIQETKNII